MQVAPVTTSAAPASSGPAEDTGSRAEQFARVLKNAFFGSGSQAVARGAEPSVPEAAQRSEQRSHDLRGNEVRVAERRESRVTENRESLGSRQSAVPQSKPAEKTAHTVTARPVEKPAETSETPDSQQAKIPADDAAAEGEATEVAVAPESSAESETEGQAAPEAVPVAAEMASSDLLLILNLLQNDGSVPPEAGQVTPTQNPVLTTLAPAQPDAPAGEGPVPLVLAPVAEAPALPAAFDAKAAQMAATPALPEGAEQPIAPEAAMAMAKATETSAAALLMQQQDVASEDFAAIQQALAAQSQHSPGQPAKAPTSPAVKPAMPEAKSADGILVVETTPGPQAPKTLIDQSALLAMQGDDASAQDAGLAFVQQQAQIPAQPQPAAAAAEAKFAAVLQTQAEAAPQPAASSALPHAPAHLNQQAAPQAASNMTAQAAQQAATQTAARHLAGYVPPGEQVAVQIKRGIGEGLDKISIRLDPGGLGKVDVKMEVGHDGKLMAVIAAEKPETLAMLQRDVQNLEQSLRDAGLKTSTDSLSFQLRDQNQAAEGREGRDGQGGNGRQRGRAGDEYAGTGQATDPAALAAANAQRAAAARGGLDIRI